MSEGRRSPVSTLIIATGAIGLAGAMVTDGLAVAGRHLGWPLTGSIEVSQGFAVLMAASAIAYASLGGDHAAVDLVFARLPKLVQRFATRINALLCLAFMVALAVGSGWIAWEHWGSEEQTELLHIPLRWLRMFWFAMACVAAGAFAGAAIRPPKGE